MLSSTHVAISGGPTSWSLTTCTCDQRRLQNQPPLPNRGWGTLARRNYQGHSHLWDSCNGRSLMYIGFWINKARQREELLQSRWIAIQMGDFILIMIKSLHV